MARAYRSAGLARSLALLWTFLLATAAILAVGAVVLSSLLSRTSRTRRWPSNAQHVALVHGQRADTGPRPRQPRRVGETALRRLRAAVRARGDVTRRLGLVAQGAARSRRRTAGAGRPRRQTRWTTCSRGDGPQVGARPRSPRGPAARSARSARSWSGRRSARPEGASAGRRRRSTIAPKSLDASVASAKRTIWIAVALVFIVLALALALLVRGASARLSRQNDAFHEQLTQLLDSTQLLEESLAPDRRDAERRGRGARPVHGRPLAASAARRARRRPHARAPVEAARHARHRRPVPRRREDRRSRTRSSRRRGPSRPWRP